MGSQGRRAASSSCTCSRTTRAAIKLYEKFGFVQEGYRRAHYRRGDQFTDAILMAYML